MVMTSSLVSETVSLGPRPSYQQRSVYSNLEVCAKRRHKEQVTFRPVLTPVKYADTAFVHINNTHRRYVSKTFYEPRMRPKTFSDTTYANPKTIEERYVSCLDHHADENKKWFKTCVLLNAEDKKFKSSRDFVPNSGAFNSTFNNSAAVDDTTAQDGYGRINGVDLGLVDENMNNRIPEPFQERYDPGASQVFIPKRSPSTRIDDLSLIEGQIVINAVDSDGIDILQLNGHADDWCDL